MKTLNGRVTFVKTLNGRVIIVNVALSDRVAYVKERLDDDCTLTDYNIGESNTLYVCCQLCCFARRVMAFRDFVIS